MKRFLFTLTLLLSSLAFVQVNAQGTYDEATMGAKVVEIETANWGQGSPFNNQCWTEYGGSTHAAAGCVPVAFAIVMRHHGFPAEGTSSTLNNCQVTGVEITDRTYNWDLMPLTSGTGWTTEQQNEVAKLISHLGHAFEVTYSASETSVSIGNSQTTALQKHFNYNYVGVSNQYNSGSMYDFDTWKSNLKSSLDNNCPVPYAANNKGAGEGDKRHMFVIDGYTENDYFHINFGWNGHCNGWYKLDEIINADNDNYSWLTSGDGYDSKHQAFFNLTPNKTKYAVTATASPSGAGTVSINGGTASSTAEESLMDGATATLVATANNGYTFNNWTKGTTVVGTDKTCKVKVASSDNDYVANFLQVSATTRVSISVDYNSSYGTVEYNGSAVSGTGITPYQNSEVILVADPVDGYVFNGWTVTKGTESKNYTGTELTLVATENMTVVANFALAETDYNFTYSVVEPSGNYEDFCSTWEYNGITLNCTKDGEAAYALHTTKDFFYATASTASSESLSSGITFTLTAPTGYTIVRYSFDCKARSSSYTVTVDETSVGTTFTTISKEINAQTTSFVLDLGTEYAGRASLEIENFVVTVRNDNAGSVEPPTTKYTVTTTANPATAGTVTGGGNYESGASVTLTATPLDGYTFAYWTNNKSTDVVTTNPYTITVSADVTYTAYFEETSTEPSVDLSNKWYRVKGGNLCLNIKDNDTHTSGTKGGVSVESRVQNSDAQIFYFEKSGSGYKLKSRSGYYIKCQQWNVDANSTASTGGTELIFESTGTELEYLIKWDNPNDNDYFMYGPANDDTSGTNYAYCNAVLTNANTWTLEEVTFSTVTATANPATAGTVTPETSTVESGSSVTFTATPADGYEFVNWTNNINTDIATANPYTFTATASGAYTATFQKKSYKITVTSGDTNGYVYIGNATTTSTTVEHGNEVTLTAVANEGCHFVNWTKGTDVVSTDAEYTINSVTAAGEYVANFAKNTYTISVSANGTGGSAMIGTGTSTTVEHGKSVSLTAVANEGYHFVNWTKGTDVVSTDAEYTINSVTATGEYVANFAKNTYTISVSANGIGGSAMIGTGTSTTVEHGNEVTLTAVANEGYHFVNWTKGTDVVSTDAEYTINSVTAAGEYVANFEKTASEQTKYAIHIETVDTDGNPLTNNATGSVKAIIDNIGQEWATAEDFVEGATAELVAVSDFNQSAYLFVGWYKNGVKVGSEHEIRVTVTEAATFQARFVKGYIVTVTSDNKTWGYPNMITYSDGSPVVGAATELKAVVEPGKELLICINPNYGFRVADWIDKNGNEVAGKNANSFTITPTGDNQYTARMERATYTLSVSTQQGTMGEVNATFQSESGVSVIVGHNMDATITATPYTGYRFVEWRKGTDFVSDENPYTVPAIENVEDMVDVEYIAVFEEKKENEAGTYYRIAYDFKVPVAAKSTATRAATDGTAEYVISTKTGSANNGEEKSSLWQFSTSSQYPASLILEAKSSGNDVNAIDLNTAQGYFDLYCGNNTDNGYVYSTTYTISVSGDYVIKGYEMTYTASHANSVNVTNEEGYNVTPDNKNTVYTMKADGLNVPNTSFTVSSVAGTKNINHGIYLNSFVVYIEESETLKVRYYVQSEACNAFGTTAKSNALLMNENTSASSIFYYADNKLLSYKEGRYLNEGGNDTRGLQDVGVADGDVEFIGNKIKVSSGTTMVYLHANEENGTYFVDHCTSKTGEDNGDSEHNFILEEVTSLPVTITEAGYATWYAPVAVQLPTGLTAYTITIHGDYAITGEGFTTVPANTGVILAGNKGDYELAITTTDEKIESILQGTVAAAYFPENDYAYVLSTDKGTRELGFYMANDGEASWSHKAYLPKSEVPSDAQMSTGFRFVLGTTGVEEVETESGNVKAIYDLTGRKLEGISGTGIYIINGKKVLVK